MEVTQGLHLLVIDTIGPTLQIATRGACAGHPDPDLWHRDDQSHESYCAACTGEAQAICQTCPIRQWCEDRGANETTGVWGGVRRSDAFDRRRDVSRHRCPSGRRQADAERKRLARAASAQSVTSVKV